MAIGAAVREVALTVAGAFSVVGQGLRLLLAHWPVLLVVLLLGAAGRELVLWASFELSKVSPVGGTILVALAPLCSVTALILALRAVMPSMQHVAAQEGMPRSRRLAVLASALVPFLAVYAAQGYLRNDTRRFLNEVTADEALSTNPFLEEGWDERTWSAAPMWVTVTIVVVALLLRWGLDRFALPERHVVFGFLAGWVEALWLVTIARTISTGWTSAWAWVLERQGVVWLVDGWAWTVSVLGPVGSAFDAAVSWLWALLGDFDTLVVVPMAWLTVGAVVYGRELGGPARGPRLDEITGRVLSSVGDERALARLERARERAVRARARAEHLPTWLRDWVAAPVTTVTDRFANLGRGLLILLRAGLVPMVTLCLVLVLARHSGVVVAELIRLALGPMDALWAQVISPYVDLVLTLSSTLLMVVLIAAAVDRFLARPAGAPERVGAARG